MPGLLVGSSGKDCASVQLSSSYSRENVPVKRICQIDLSQSGYVDGFFDHLQVADI